jgi:DNA-binding transcriptional MerR regulator
MTFSRMRNRNHPENKEVFHMDMQQTREAVKVLREQGFSQAEIERLNQLRKSLRQQRFQQDLLAQRRLEFIRWLVVNGRITEEVA